jgi:2-keto-4-pentenoate hydratase/2-oxohepta-3-ene-1,7-dioic acid hydratase in catechol pathway
MALWVRFQDGGRDRFGVLEGTQIARYFGDMFGEHAPDGTICDLADVALLTPIAPRTFIGLWNNFRALAVKTGQPEPDTPLYFIKAPGCVLAPGETIRRPKSYDGRIIFEGELGIVIGAACRHADEAAAERAIFGYTCVNDVTALQWVSEPGNFPQWARAKSCDTFGPFGPAIATGLDWSTLQIRSVLNGRERQNYPASDMIFTPPQIVSLLSREITFAPGDIIACGTSVGALPMRPGDTIEIQIDGIGTLTSHLEQEAAS